MSTSEERRAFHPDHGPFGPRLRLWRGLCCTVLGWAVLGSAVLGCAGDETEPAGGCPAEYAGPGGDPEDLIFTVPVSCSFFCQDCAEPATPYACPAMAPWSQVPHAEACGCFDGKPPAVVEGSCSVSEPTGDALRPAGPQGDQTWVLPNGHVIAPAGTYAALDGDGLEGTFPMTLLPLQGTSLLLSSDGGVRDNVLRLLDVQALVGSADPTVAHVEFAKPTSLYHGVVWLAPDTALASGGGDGFVYAFDVDTAGPSLSRDEARDIDLGGPTGQSYGEARWYSGPMAIAMGGTRLIVAPSVGANHLQVRSIEPASWGEALGTIGIDSQSVFEIAADPFDPNGETLYATLWDGDSVIEINAATMEATRSLEVGKNPEGLTFLDETLMVVAAADVDRLTVIDRSAWVAKGSVDLFEDSQPYGHGPTELAFDSVRNRLYATLSGVNALAVFDVTLGASDAGLAPAGRIPTAWWPTDVVVQDDGSLVVLAGKGTGTGPDQGTYPYGDGPITTLLHGGVQYVDVPTPTELSTMTDTAEAARQLAATEGYPEVTCPGSTYDFPVPRIPAEGPSDQIEHVIFILRENKTYDHVFGDLPTGNGDPGLVVAPGEMEELVPNARKLALGFANFDNYYTDAEQSLQGHVWAVFGRTTDFIERSWLTSWGRGTRPPMAGVSDQGQPAEGGLFHALDRAGVDYANMGEIVGIGETPLDPRYPGLVYAGDRPDIEKSCYIAARARALCELPSFIFAVMPNDHTHGGNAGSPHPGVMIAVNDEATGMVVDAVSHSPLWPKSLVIITEDDPQNGGDHVDVHRTLLFMASPWVKRGYVSRGHYDTSSVHKLILTILGVPYPNESIAQAPMPFDAFTATPDYTPYDYLHRTYDRPCNPDGTGAAATARSWDLSEPDEQPGIAYWVWRILHDKSYD